ncbi:ribosome small subunit-dependent GTPase A [Bacillaceae bacterium Marseille-Q3522]|nr:ribosome small subunit-dependent GTPase A [Bacillaceae bacterium Marseille-Q3522]
MPEGKIIKALSGFYYVMSHHSVFQCRGRGIFRKNKITPLVGDEVIFQAENEAEGYLMEIKNRRNELKRPPVANIDQAILVFSAKEPEFSTLLLDRFLVLMEAKQIEPLICITKLDLADQENMVLLEEYAGDYRRLGYNVLLSSSVTKSGIFDLLPFFQGKISVFAGQSGVGKSSLLNVLQPDLKLKTAAISNYLGRGKHTTRHVELIELGDGLVADTPGFSSLDFTDISENELNDCFPEIKEKSEQCKFRGCLHVFEPKCAVKKAYENKEFPAYRYEHYCLFLQEIKERKPRY